ncbi:unnamed protein product [Prorocentrum cordatum]|uniref:Uncharacterized protein n=1 Tax=Prorocentrum cordatum TaxID=2364126 RepID=A0ABN9VEW4_9DINO|nr:unnamed protein product [Polarella glacialis]
MASKAAAARPPAWLLKGSCPASSTSGSDGLAPPPAKNPRKGDKDGDHVMGEVDPLKEKGGKSGGKGGKSGQGRRGGRRRRRGNHSEKNWTSKDQNLMQCLATLTKLTLQTAFKQRLTSATTIDMLTIPETHRVVHRLEAVMIEYRKKVEAARPSGAEALREVGSPVASLVVGLLESLMECDISGKAKADLDKYVEQIIPVNGEEPPITRTHLELDAAAIRIERCFDEEKVKLQVAAPVWPMRGTVTNAFISEGVALRHTGVAPPGLLEDEMASWLEVLTQ